MDAQNPRWDRVIQRHRRYQAPEEVAPFGVLRHALSSATLLAAAACGGPGFLHAPTDVTPAATTPALELSERTLERYAPVVLQEVGVALLDTPTPLDPECSGRLGDDDAAFDRPSPMRVPFYSSARADGGRPYLLYALYYPVDWSGDPRSARIDHVGDFEGALVIVSRASGRVDAVVTQAHRRFYLWSPAGDPVSRGASGTFGVSAEGRPLLFAEAGGHGLYAFGYGRWFPKGGNRYPVGTAGMRPDRLLRIEVGSPAGEQRIAAEVRPLRDLLAFTEGERGAFRGLPRGARPPWLWDDKGHRELPPGLILDDPARLLDALNR